MKTWTLAKRATTGWSGTRGTIPTSTRAPLIQITVDGGAGVDTLLGSNGADLLIGGDNDDFIDGQQGNDVVFLGAQSTDAWFRFRISESEGNAGRALWPRVSHNGTINAFRTSTQIKLTHSAIFPRWTGSQRQDPGATKFDNPSSGRPRKYTNTRQPQSMLLSCDRGC